MGENPEQSHPTDPLQCAPCEGEWEWVWTGVAETVVADASEENEQRLTTAAEQAATIARERTSFFIFNGPDSCRAQLLSLFLPYMTASRQK